MDVNRELPTEPEMLLSRAAREAALSIWVEHHSLSDDLRGLLGTIVAGYQSAALCARLGIGEDELTRLENSFDHTFSQTVYIVAADIIEQAYQSGTRRD